MAKKKTPHKRPDPKELDEGIGKVLDELDELENDPEVAEPVEEEPESDTEEWEEPEPSKEILKDIVSREKEKNVASSREAQILHAKNRKITEAIENASDIPEPTEDEMKKEYSDWDVMSDFEKKMAKQTLTSSRRFNTIGEVTKEFKDLDAWEKKVEDFVDDPNSLVKHPRLDGKQEEFRTFATKPSRRGVSFEDLIPAFLYKAEEEAPKKQKGSMFEQGSGGPAEKVKKSNKISIEDAGVLRKTNYAKYKEYLKGGKISTEI